MPAYILVDLDRTDHEKSKAYANAVQDTVTNYTDRYTCKWG